MWQIMCGYLIVVKIVAKTKFSYKWYMNGQMNMYTLIVYIIHGPFGDVALNHDLWLDVECDFTYAIKSILVINVGCKWLIVANWNCKMTFFF